MLSQVEHEQAFMTLGPVLHFSVSAVVGHGSLVVFQHS